MSSSSIIYYEEINGHFSKIAVNSYTDAKIKKAFKACKTNNPESVQNFIKKKQEILTEDIKKGTAKVLKTINYKKGEKK